MIDALIAGRDWVFLKGNHDRMFAGFVRHRIEHDTHVKSGVNWLNARLGGEETLASYGINGDTHLTPHTRGNPDKLVHTVRMAERIGGESP